MRLPISLLAVFCAGAAGPAPVPPKAADATVLHFVPKARANSTYTFSARFDITDRDISFEAPKAYKEGFDFWAGRMRGQRRSEAYEMTTITQEADANGMIPFRRTIPKFDLEFERQGQQYATAGPLERDVTSLVWEGSLDPYGNLKKKRKVGGRANPEIDTLSIPEIDRVFPVVEGTRDIKIGEGFKEERVIPLPTQLNIAGLEDVTLRLTREYTLKSAANGLATFDVKTTYANDPGFKPKGENTACSISGGGTGEALFEVKRGVFVRTRLPSSMRIDIEAPLRPLPGHPETDKPSTGKSHINLDIVFSGEQIVKRVWGEDSD